MEYDTIFAAARRAGNELALVDAGRLSRTVAKAAALLRENAILKAQNRLAQTNNEENARLRDLLNLRPQNYDLELETASVTERTVTNWTSSLTLNIGTDHGVEVNDCVIDETYALVGVVSEVGLNWCTVGDFSLMRENRLRLDYLPADCQLLGGDLVVTSGLGGYYPSGLSVGTVEEVQLSDSGAASYAVLEPAADFDSLVEVFVIKSFDIQT